MWRDTIVHRPVAKTCTVPKPSPQQFCGDVVNVARNREPGQTIKQIATDFGIAESCLRNWMRAAG